MKSDAIFAVIFAALALGGCDKKTDSAAPSGTSGGTQATTQAVTAGGCDVVAFEKDQDDNGRGDGKAKKFSGCKFKSYDAKTKKVTFDKNGASDSLTCLNADDPKLTAGDSADIDAFVDGSMFLTLNRCKISKK